MVDVHLPVTLKVLRRRPNVVSGYSRCGESGLVVLAQPNPVATVVPRIGQHKWRKLQYKPRRMSDTEQTPAVIWGGCWHGGNFNRIAYLLTSSCQPGAKLRSDAVCLCQFSLDALKLFYGAVQVPLLSIQVAGIFVQQQKFVLNSVKTLSKAHHSSERTFISLFGALFMSCAAISFTVHKYKSTCRKSQYSRPQRLVALNPFEHHNAPPPAEERVSHVHATTRPDAPFDQIEHQPNGETYRGEPCHISPSPTHMRPLNAIGALKRDSVKGGA